MRAWMIAFAASSVRAARHRRRAGAHAPSAGPCRPPGSARRRPQRPERETPSKRREPRPAPARLRSAAGNIVKCIGVLMPRRIRCDRRSTRRTGARRQARSTASPGRPPQARRLRPRATRPFPVRTDGAAGAHGVANTPPITSKNAFRESGRYRLPVEGRRSVEQEQRSLPLRRSRSDTSRLQVLGERLARRSAAMTTDTAPLSAASTR